MTTVHDTPADHAAHPLTDPRSARRPWLVLLILIAVGLAAFVAVDSGNTFGDWDEWGHIYSVSQGGVAYYNYTNRPIEQIGLAPVYWLAGADRVGHHIAHLFFRIATAFLIYLTLRQLRPDDDRFALACASLSLCFVVRDWFFILSFSALDTNVAPILLTWSAFYLLSRALASPSWANMLGAAAPAVVVIFMRETPVPMLMLFPILIVVLRKDFRRRTLIWSAVWIGMIGILGLWYLLPVLGLAPETYASGYFSGLRLSQLAYKIQRHLKAAFLDVSAVELSPLRRFLLPAAIATTVGALGMRFLPRTDPSPEARPKSVLAIDFTWVMVGLSLTLAGLAVYLPTYISERLTRVHQFASAGEAITLVSVIWLVSHLARNERVSLMLSSLGFAFLIAAGTTLIAWLQDDVYIHEGTWDAQATFVRSLANQAPYVEDNTLFVHIEDPELSQSPFYGGFEFQFAVRYLYADAAGGLIPTDNLAGHEWEVRADGIAITPVPPDSRWVGARHSFHRWDEMIFVAKRPDGRVVILDDLPPEFYTPDRAALYAPYDRISPAYVSATIQELLPPIQALNPGAAP